MRHKPSGLRLYSKKTRGTTAVPGHGEPVVRRHGRACPGHLSLSTWRPAGETWMPATSAGMTEEGRFHLIATRCSFFLTTLTMLAVLAATIGIAAGQDTGPPKLHTNEAYVEEVTTATTLAIDDPMAVFAFVLNSLPDRVKVYPTENYYYFTFIHGGAPYAGNIRIELGDGDKVTVHFVYYQDWSEWHQDSPLTHVVLDSSRGVGVEKLERLTYRLSYSGKSVVFALNDLSQVKPPAAALARGEKFIGPIFDESAIRFFLVYNSKLKIFHYILDETVKVADEFFLSRRTGRILIGKRTGFAFYQDRRLDRKILVGVYEGNYRRNNYFDGPFDQLPDNFIEGETLREIIL